MHDLKTRPDYKMKKACYVSILLLIFISLMFTCSCRNSSGKLPVLYGQSDWERMGLHGSVNALALYNVPWQESFGKITPKSGPVIDQSTEFLNTGNQSESTYYDTNGIPNWKDTFIYAADGDTWLECVSYKYVNPEKTVTSPQWSYTNSYDNGSRLIKVSGYNYDANGQKLAAESWVHIYDYLPEKSQIVHSSYKNDGTLQWKNISLYNSNALEIESTQYDNNGNIQWKDKFKYDSQGNKTEWYRFDSDLSLEWKDVFKYDANGNEIECSSFDHRNQLMWKNVYRYLDESDLTNFDINQNSDSVNKFDSRGNWTIKMTLEEKSGFGGRYLAVQEIVKRDIVYFP